MAYDLKASFQHSARYNERANQEMFAALTKLTGRARRREVGAWFGSIHGVLNPSNCSGENGHMSVDLDTPLRLPCGVELPNRLLKSAMNRRAGRRVRPCHGASRGPGAA